MSIVERLNKLADELDLWFGPNKPAGNELRTIATDLRADAEARCAELQKELALHAKVASDLAAANGPPDFSFAATPLSIPTHKGTEN